MIFKDSRWYNICKYISVIVLPAVIALIAALGQAWGWDQGLVTAITATLAAVDTFFNALLQISSNQYHKMIDEQKLADDQ